ncbi:FkbM family methyltransferase [uncultured Jannaschia sp.]|uniref:FkbM family methyltransferase n=1 Tax=uncultured Jannaschia sp. TaxID=293347 RepID=UPI00262658B8|nr:FkbM family methyltransferase [uncultured Jannaschia sp.]
MAMPDKMQASYFRGYDFAAPTIVDVGVLAGTPFLYESFPDRRFLLVDPLEESRDTVARRWPGLDHAFHVCALGAAPGRMTLSVDRRRLARSTGGARTGETAMLERREVEVRTLDSLTDGLPGPIGLKIDTEGHELEVLQGATATLARCEFVVAEISIKKRFAGGYRFSQVIAFMAVHGFEVHSFLSGLTRAPRMSDVLFLPADDPRFDMPPGRS